MWLQIVWQFRFPIAVLLFILACGVGWKAYSWQHDRAQEWQDRAATAERLHDQLVDNYKKEQAVSAERERLRIEREKENARLWGKIKELLDSPPVRDWSTTPVPDALRRLPMDLQGGVPELPAPAGGSGPPARR